MDELEAACYVWKEEYIDGLEDAEWDFERWERDDLAEYVEMCRDCKIQREDDKMDFEELREKAMLRSRNQEERLSETGSKGSRAPSKEGSRAPSKERIEPVEEVAGDDEEL